MRSLVVCALLALSSLASAHETAAKRSLGHRLIEASETHLAPKLKPITWQNVKSRVHDHLVRMSSGRDENEHGLWKIEYRELYEHGTYGHELARGRFGDVAIYAAKNGALPIVSKTTISITEVPPAE